MKAFDLAAWHEKPFKTEKDQSHTAAERIIVRFHTFMGY